MANTRNHNNNNNGEKNQNVNSPPPAPPTLEQVLVMQGQMLQTMQQTMINMQAAQSQAPPPPPRDRLGDFQRTKPPTFSQAVELMDADDWLQSMEKKLQVIQCNNREKVLLASHQLSGSAADWWDAYVQAHEESKSINWPEFRATFRTHHVPQGLGPGVRLPGGWVKPYPLTRVGLGNARETLNSFYKFKPFQYKFKFKLRTTSIHKIKYKSTSSHNKI
jgi:hypothetical protein